MQYFDSFFSESGLTTQFSEDTVVIVLTPSYFRNVNSLAVDRLV